ncbi:MAG: 30S ribosomal protein S9 [Myxococcales bacterium]|jgi:small subunit ribosomal protein S9|nr:30S ribosomal protein S9 [Myxococcales bacterium]MBL8721127.1 30S ribosomal protein S9 [Myxococcales bacterium]
MATTDNRTYATGKRKCASARVWIMPGTGKISVNKRTFEDYFVRETSRMIVKQPLELLEAVDQFDVFVNVRGGGTSAQAEAVRHGISRALCAADGERRPSLKRAGFLTRDSRKVERKKYGRPGARKRFQYSKR